MTDRIFLRLSEKWALGYDRNQWIVMVYRGSRWRSISFIGSHKGVLMRVLKEKGVIPPARLWTPSQRRSRHGPRRLSVPIWTWGRPRHDGR